MSIETGNIPTEIAAVSAPYAETAGIAEATSPNLTTPNLPEQKAIEEKDVDQGNVRNIIIEQPKPLIGSYRPASDGLSEFTSMLFEAADVMANIVHLGTAVVEEAAVVAKPLSGQVGEAQGSSLVAPSLGRGPV